MRQYSADTIANWFLAWADDSKTVLHKTKLQKLVSYAQAHHIHLYGAPLFDDRVIRAWEYGPVVINLLGLTVKHEGAVPLDQAFSWDDVAEDTANFLVSVWNTYGGISSSGLIELTHHEDFWLDIYDPTVRPSREITVNKLTELYSPAL